ncbi:hypothetical protein OH77DRAFT_511337 [Trametes cingulata]|nr:hypothetical protein OH77DRAFT_511337 [Trametes cingulata]
MSTDAHAGEQNTHHFLDRRVVDTCAEASVELQGHRKPAVQRTGTTCGRSEVTAQAHRSNAPALVSRSHPAVVIHSRAIEPGHQNGTYNRRRTEPSARNEARTTLTGWV